MPELQRNGIDLQTKANENLYRLHQRTGIPLVATNDIHYLRAEDCTRRTSCVHQYRGETRRRETLPLLETDTLYFKTREEMAHMFRDLPDAVRATMDVAERVDLNIEFGKYHMPEFISDTGEAPNVLFDRLLNERLPQLYPGDDQSRARERLHHESQVIKELGFVSYFLIVWDLIRWARQNGIPVGPGRGSAAGSIVAYLLDITRVDPLTYDLLFERFLNSSRVSMPDIDIDFCKDGRERVIEYTRQKYGRDSVTQIVTFGTMASRTVIRDVGRVLDVPLREVDKIAKKIPAGPGAPSLGKALETDPELQAFRNESELYRQLFDFSVPLEGMARHVSTHAAGVVITPRPTVEFVPLGRNGEDITTQYPAPQLEELGLLKMDYLGLRTLTIIEKTLRNIEKMGGTPPDLENLPAGDPATYQLLMQGDTLGVFQLESEGMRKLLARLKPDCFEDIAAVLALYRPGPLESGMVDMFVNRKHGREKIEYPHPSVEKILRPTYGCLVYQEQIMLVSVELGGFSLNDADNLRKAMGKKKPEIMQKFSAQFVEGAVSKGCDAGTAQEVWDIILKFGGYGFNKSHTAAYAVITYQTAFLKANFRTAFLAANFSCEMGDSAKVKNFLDDCKKARVSVLPPSIMWSTWDFEPEGEGSIRFGLGAIKGVGKRAAESLVEVRDRLREEGTALDLHGLSSQVDPAQVGKLCWESVIKAGVFDETGHNRGAVLAALEGALADASVAAESRRTGQMSMFEMFGGAAEEAAGPAALAIDDSKALGLMDTLALEYEVLGFYLTGHPLQEKAGMVGLLSSSPIPDFVNLPGNSEVRVAGLVLQKAELLVKSGRMAGSKMCRFRLEDLHGSISATVFPRTYEECKHYIEDGAVLLCMAKLEDSGEEPALIIDRILPINQALETFQGGISVQLDPRDETILDALHDLVVRNKGDRPLFLQVTGDDGHVRRVRVHKHHIQIGEEIAQELIGLLGDGRVGLVRI
ncbi:MAG: DNA polymerase III subunit alpha [Planctomycetota bacterium]